VGGSPRWAVESGHLDELSFAVETPTVEGTGNAVSAYTPSDAEMGTEMRTMGIEDARTSVLASEHH
jgi:hypothetical protein